MSTQPELILAIGLRKVPMEIVDEDFKNNISNGDLHELLPLIQLIT